MPPDTTPAPHSQSHRLLLLHQQARLWFHNLFRPRKQKKSRSHQHKHLSNQLFRITCTEERSAQSRSDPQPTQPQTFLQWIEARVLWHEVSMVLQHTR